MIGTEKNIGDARASKPSEATEPALERDLVLAAKRGDRGAFKVLAERYYRRLYKMLAAFTRNDDTAMDLTQETFVRALQALPDFELNSSFYTWIYRIGMNLALDRCRRNRTQGDSVEFDDRLEHDGASELALHGEIREPQRLVETQEALQKVQAALDVLRPEHRQIIVLRELEGMSYDEIATVLDLKIGTVMSRLFSARMTLREILEKRYGMRV